MQKVGTTDTKLQRRNKMSDTRKLQEPPLSEGLVSSACYAVRALKWAHCGKEGWMSEYATNIEIEDEGAGEFLVISQPFANVKLSAGGIAITAEEWPTLRAAIEAAFAEISKHNAQVTHARNER